MVVRTKDKVFLAVVVPLALAAAYVWLWRLPTEKRLESLREEHRRLPDVEMFPMERRQLEQRAQEAERELAAARAEKPKEGAVKGDPTASATRRQDAVVAALTAKGVKVRSVAPVQSSRQEDARGMGVLRDCGVRPTPVAIRLEVEAEYSVLVQALRAFADARAPVVPESVSLSPANSHLHWSFVLWI